MEIKEKDFRKTVEYVKSEIVKEAIDGIIKVATIRGVCETISLEEFLKTIGEKKERSKPDPFVDDKGFSLFWDAYPSSANFKYKGMTFNSPRVLRSNKQVCQNLYMKAFHENPELTPEMLLKAIQKQVLLAKKESVEKGVNQLAFLPGIEVYIRQARYEAFVQQDGEEESVDTEEESQSEYNNQNCG